MAEKTPLELDIEHRERYRSSFGVKAVIAMLFLCLFLVGAYSIQLKHELAAMEQDTALMKESYTKEKVELLRQIKQLQAEKASRDSSIE